MAESDPLSKFNPPSETTEPLGQDEVTGPVKRRLVYEPTLLPPRKRLRVSPWIVIPSLLLFCTALLCALLLGPHKRRFIPTAGEIVFVSDQGTPGQPHLWIAKGDGSGAHRLTSGTAEETSPSWSPDGTQIAFLSTRPGGDPQIFVADADGQNVVQVTHNGGGKSQPQFAPSDNTLIGYLSGGALNLLDTTTGQSSRLLPILSAESHIQSAVASQVATPILSFAWSPAKLRAQQGLAAVEDVNGIQALVLLPTLTGQPRDTRDNSPGSPPLAAANGLWPAWSPDGAILALALQEIAGLPKGRHGSGLVTFDSLGNPMGQHPLAYISSAAASPENPVFLLGGTQIVFELWQGRDEAHQQSVGLFIVPVDGSAPPREIVPGPMTNARFSLDSQSLFFLRQRPDGGHNLYLASTGGSGLQRLSDGKADVTDEAVSPQVVSH